MEEISAPVLKQTNKVSNTKSLKTILKPLGKKVVEVLLKQYRKNPKTQVQSFIKIPKQWVSLSDFDKLERYIKINKSVNHRTIQKDEIVIDVDSENKVYGRIHLAALEQVWNILNYKREQWESGGDGYHCLPVKEKVFIKENNFIRLVELRSIPNMLACGKTVFIKSPNGWVKILNAVIREQYKDERLAKFYLSNGTPIVSSLDHRFLIYDNATNKVVIKDAKDITLKDRFIYNRDFQKGNNIGTYNLGRFIGLFLADGHYIRQGLVFTFDSSEKDYIKFLKKYSEQYGARTHIIEKKTYIRIHIYSQGLKALINDFSIGTYSKDLKLKSSVYGMNEEFRKGILNGWLEGDGLHRQYNDGVSISKGLIKSMNYIAIGLGMYTSITNSVNDTHNRRYKLHIFKNPKIEYKTNIKNPPINHNYINIKEINKNFKKKTKLIDIEVDSKDHLFTLGCGIVTHNCHYIVPSLNKISDDDISEVKKELIKYICGNLMYMYKHKPTNRFLFYNKKKKSSTLEKEQLEECSHICLVDKKLIQIEWAPHRKGGVKKPFISDLGYTKSGFIEGKTPRIPKKVKDLIETNKNKRKAEYALRKWSSEQFSNSKYPACIRFYLGETIDGKKFADERDGTKRAMFHLISFFGHTKTDDELVDFIQDWLHKISLGQGAVDSHGKILSPWLIRSAIKSNKGIVGCRARMDLLTELGCESICNGCPYKR